jgi:hypothetical protein
MHLKNVCLFSRDYTALYPRRYNSSQTPLWERQIPVEKFNSVLSYFMSWMRK